MSEQPEVVSELGIPRLGGSMGQAGGAYRVLSVRMSEDTRAQLEVLAQLNNRSLTDETRHALEAWVERSKSDPSVLRRAEQVRAEIEREAQTKRNAIAAVLGATDGEAAPAESPRANTLRAQVPTASPSPTVGTKTGEVTSRRTSAAPKKSATRAG